MTAEKFLDKNISRGTSLTEAQRIEIPEIMERYADLLLSAHFANLPRIRPAREAKKVNHIITVIRQHFKADFMTQGRKRKFVWPRHVACYCLRQFTRLNHEQIAEAVGYPTDRVSLHRYSMYACDKVTEQCEVDEDARKDILQIETIIQEWAG